MKSSLVTDRSAQHSATQPELHPAKDGQAPRFAHLECDPFSAPHRIEQEVQRTLLGQPDLRFSSLVIRRTADGVCLQGFMESSNAHTDVCSLARKVAGVQNVINQLVTTQCPAS